jgi:hypothetical protein
MKTFREWFKETEADKKLARQGIEIIDLLFQRQNQRLENYRDDLKELHNILRELEEEPEKLAHILQNWGERLSPGEYDERAYRRHLIGEEHIRKLFSDVRRSLVDILD